MPDSKHRKEKLNVRVPPSIKESWQAELQDGETLTSLVIRAVNRELNDEYVAVDTLDEIDGGGVGDVDFSEVTERLDDLQGTVESLHRELNAVTSTGSSYDQDRVSSVAMDLMDHIPNWTEGTDGDPTAEGMKETKLKLVEDGLKSDLHNERPLRIDGSTAKLADKAGEPPALVRQALIYLEQRTTAEVESIVVAGQRHWVQL